MTKMSGSQTMTLGSIIVLATLTALSLACNDHLRKNQETIVHSIKSEVVHICPDEDCEDKYCKRYNCSSDPPDASLVSTSVNKELGKLTVTYKMKRQQEYTGIDINLMACEKVSEDECNPSVISKPWWTVCEYHSTKYISLKWINSTDKDGSQTQNCSKNITVTFDYVYSSCYFILISRCSENSIKQSRDVFSCPKIEQTNKRKEFLVNKTIGYADTCKRSTDTDGGYIFLRIVEDLEDVPLANMTIEKIIGNTTVDLLFCQNKTINGRSEWDCTFFDNQTTGNQCTIDRVKKDGVPTSEIERTCSLYNLKDGNYSYSVSYDDLRCQTGTVWTGNKYVKTQSRLYCRWHSNIFCQDKPEDKVVRVPKYEYLTFFNITLYVAISLAIITPLSLLIAKLYYKPKGGSDPDSILYEPVSFSSQGSSAVSITSEDRQKLNDMQIKVLLVYARDCEKFHDVMNKFSTVLKLYGFKVFDFWDDAQAKEVAYYNNESWLEMKMDEADRIVLVASECAVELERRNLRGIGGEQYLSPRNFDRLFNYALRLLRKFMSLESEKKSGKVFLVSIKDSLDGNDPCTFSTFSPSLYCLPQQLAPLLLDLKRIDRPSELGELKESNEVLELKEAAKLLTEYIMMNPNYSKTILE